MSACFSSRVTKTHILPDVIRFEQKHSPVGRNVGSKVAQQNGMDDLKWRKNRISRLDEASSYLVRWSHGCGEHPCKMCGEDCPYHEAWLAQSDLR